MRDVTFDTSKRYSAHDEEVEITEAEIQVYEVPEVQLDQAIDYDMRLSYTTGVAPAFETTIDNPGDTVIVDSESHKQIIDLEL